MRTNPNTYSEQLVRKQGMDKALKIAEDLVKTSKAVLDAEGGVPMGDEIEISTYDVTVTDKNGDTKTVTRERTDIDQPAMLRRAKKSVAFWNQVNAILLKKKAKMEAAKAVKH